MVLIIFLILWYWQAGGILSSVGIKCGFTNLGDDVGVPGWFSGTISNSTLVSVEGLLEGIMVGFS